MKKFLSYIFISMLLVGVFVPLTNIRAQFGNNALSNLGSTPKDAVGQPAPTTPSGSGLLGTIGGALADGLIYTLARMSYLFLGLMSLLVYCAGVLLNFVLNWTIVNMAAHINGGLDTNGVTMWKALTGINVAWKVLRDLMNIFFIFLLVYEGIIMIIGVGKSNAKSLVTGIIVASLLVNFSLFFTKVLIDASNLVTIGFYNSILDATKSSSTQVANSSGGVNTIRDPGLSIPFMNALHVSNFWSGASFEKFSESIGGSGGGQDVNRNLVIVGIVGSILFVIVSFVFFAISVMFIIRYLILVMLLMLSPIGFMGLLPHMKKYSSQWWEVLTGQLLFAPLYMLMTWVILTLMASPGFVSVEGSATWTGMVMKGTNGAANPDSISLLFNFALVIGLMVFSLATAKKFATQGSGMIADFTKSATAFAGGAIMGTTAWAGRKTVGWTGTKLADSAKLQNAASKNNTNIFTRTLARPALYASQKARQGSFDVRAATIPTNVAGDFIQGTIGRTSAGRFFGLDEVNIPAVEVGAYAAGLAGAGKAGTKGYKELSAEKAKRIKDRETAEATELAVANAKKAIIDGSKAGATAGPGGQIEAMEKALAKLSDKETEALVASNRELLDSQNFANAISVKQLEVLNKSEQFSSSEKGGLKDKRFKDINAAVIATPPVGSTPAQIAAFNTAQKDIVEKALSNMSEKETEMWAASNKALLAKSRFAETLSAKQLETINKSDQFTETEKETLKKTRFADINAAMANPSGPARAAAIKATKSKIKDLADSELEMIDADYLKDPDFVAELKQSQVDAINKSNKFTTSQRDALKKGRQKPLLDALATANGGEAVRLFKKADYKTKAAFIAMDIPGVTPARKVGLDPLILPAYNIKMLTKLGDTIEDDTDKQALKDAIIADGRNTGLITWLGAADKGGALFI